MLVLADFAIFSRDAASSFPPLSLSLSLSLSGSARCGVMARKKIRARATGKRMMPASFRPTNGALRVAR